MKFIKFRMWLANGLIKRLSVPTSLEFYYSCVLSLACALQPKRENFPLVDFQSYKHNKKNKNKIKKTKVEDFNLL